MIIRLEEDLLNGEDTKAANSDSELLTLCAGCLDVEEAERWTSSSAVQCSIVQHGNGE